jgi:hypothetical protein
MHARPAPCRAMAGPHDYFLSDPQISEKVVQQTSIAHVAALRSLTHDSLRGHHGGHTQLYILLNNLVLE